MLDNTTSTTTVKQRQTSLAWRDVLPVHPAADLFPMMSDSELKEFADDIATNGLQQRIKLRVHKGRKPEVVDGRNRLSALELAGKAPVKSDGSWMAKYFDEIELADEEVAAYVISANIHRRHLTAEKKLKLVEKVIKLDPTKSNRQIANTTGTSHPTVAKLRTKLEKTGDVEKVTTSIDTKGRRQPAKRIKSFESRTRASAEPIDQPPSAEPIKVEAVPAPADIKPAPAGAEDGIPSFLRRQPPIVAETPIAEPLSVADSVAEDFQKLVRATIRNAYSEIVGAARRIVKTLEEHDLQSYDFDFTPKDASGRQRLDDLTATH
jgi:ParB-like chromosome segregation protein Spo0J